MVNPLAKTYRNKVNKLDDKLSQLEIQAMNKVNKLDDKLRQLEIQATNTLGLCSLDNYKGDETKHVASTTTAII